MTRACRQLEICPSISSSQALVPCPKTAKLLDLTTRPSSQPTYSMLRRLADIGTVLGAALLLALPRIIHTTPDIDLAHILTMPSWAHPLGTDHLGRDLLGRIAAALWETVLPLWGWASIATFLGFALGFVSVHMQLHSLLGPSASCLRFLVRGVAGLPAVVVVFALGLVFGTGFASVAVGLCLFFILRAAEVVENLWTADKNLGFWHANTALGGAMSQQIWHYGLVGAWRPVLTSLVCFHLRVGLIVETTLSYLGFGVQEPASSFGNLIAAHFELILRGDARVCFTIIGAFCLCAALPDAWLRLGRVVNSSQNESLGHGTRA